MGGAPGVTDTEVRQVASSLFGIVPHGVQPHRCNAFVTNSVTIVVKHFMRMLQGNKIDN